MTCYRMGDVIACGPPPGVYRRRVDYCPECERDHRFIERWGGAWYGTEWFGSCGDRWQDGFRMGRPFQRGWRAEEQARFRRMWEHAASREAYDRYVKADCAVYGPDVRTKRQERKVLRRVAVASELLRREQVQP